MALACLGSPGPNRAGFTIYERVAGTWIIPAGVGRAGPRRSGVYRPATRSQALVAHAIELLHRTGTMPRLSLNSEVGVAKLISDLVKCDVELAASYASGRTTRDPRAVLAAWSCRWPRRLVAIAKVGSRDQLGRFERERLILERIQSAEPRTFRVPEPLGVIVSDHVAGLVVRPLPTPGRAYRDFTARDARALVELAGILDEVPDSDRGRRAGQVLVHGDFVPWNTADAAGVISVWDWEHARWGLPLDDYFHWRLQSIALFDRGTPEGLVREMRAPTKELSYLCERYALQSSELEAYLRYHVSWALANPIPGWDERTLLVRRSVLALLR